MGDDSRHTPKRHAVPFGYAHTPWVTLRNGGPHGHDLVESPLPNHPTPLAYPIDIAPGHEP